MWKGKKETEHRHSNITSREWRREEMERLDSWVLTGNPHEGTKVPHCQPSQKEADPSAENKDEKGNASLSWCFLAVRN